MKSQCPCGAVYTIRPEFLGKRTICKNCGRNFLIKALPEPSPSEYLELRPEDSETPLSAPPAAGKTRAAPRETEPAEEPEELLELVEPAEPEELVLEEIEPVQEPDPSPPPDPAGYAGLPAEAQAEGGRQPFLALAVAAVAGALVGAGLMGLLRQSEIDGLEARLAAFGREFQGPLQAGRNLGALKKELDQVQDEVRLLEKTDYPAGSIPQTLAAAAVMEYKTAEALLRQQVTALESGAGLAVAARATAPDPELAAAVELEMAGLQARLEALRGEAEGLAEEPRSLAQTAIATEELSLAILNRNRLIARYGLSTPLPPRRPGGDGPPPGH